ncbi:VWA domain-containing protein, partial [archaeon]
MTFLAWGFLLASLAAAIPVVLHMINRQRAKDLPFPTLRFLRISVQKTKRRKRIHDLLLMLIRAMVLILIAFGLADARLTTLKSLLGGGAKSAVAIILDNSASMGTTDPERPRFETATNAVQQILDELQSGDQVALFPTCGEPLPDQDELDATQTKVQQVLAQCRQRGVSFERADLAAKLRQARKLLAGSKASHKQIYVNSDFQPVSWEAWKKEAESAAENEEGAELDREEQETWQIPVICVDCDRRPRANVAVQKVTFDAPVPVVGVPIKVQAEVLNTSVLDQNRRVELVVDDRKEDT